MTKSQVDTATTNLHKWMTIIGFPVLVILVGDMYKDFKDTRNATIKHEQQINDLVRTTEKHENNILTITTYLFGRGK